MVVNLSHDMNDFRLQPHLGRIRNVFSYVGTNLVTKEGQAKVWEREKNGT
jgi:hypothetical protein